MKSKWRYGLGMFLVFLVICFACMAETVDLADHAEHNWVHVSQRAATCGEAGFETLYCDVCGEEKVIRLDAATGAHDLGADGICRNCGYIDMQSMSAEEAIETHGFYHEDLDMSGTYSTGDRVLFGSYPQTLIRETDAVFAELSAYLEGNPDGNWQSYSYYSEGNVSDYMVWQDVEMDGRTYRGVRMSAYRPYYTGLPADAEYSYIDDSGYALDTVYWFAWEPIAWNVLEYQDGCLLLNAAKCLDAQPFQDLYEGNRSKMVIPGTEILTNDWSACSVRRFLNETFVATAFDSASQNRMQMTHLNNRTTGYEPNAKFQITQTDTEDLVYLLSFEDVLRTDYGYPDRASFDLEANGDNINEVEDALNRRRSYTDYAAIQGCRPSTQGVTKDDEPACYYMLRSAGSVKFSISGVSKYGSASYQGSINPTSKASQDGLSFNGDFGLLPVIRIQVGH